ncbi:prolyl oligopeptidase family serine peptidase [Mucilaginibacter sp. HMF7410]|uniref:Prolyl oligopeptidase family serine peptidase n=2 Tax=Mucilaginibacter arboris TaxID=2682090 RepID=A0A7K1SU53_9SPHI|nr:prolyl oligopeptidase family serine peptidase [Mucilaginibacter arboris]
MKIFFYTCFLMSLFSFSMLTVKAQTVIPLYPGAVPNSIPGPDQEVKSGTPDNIHYSKVTKPTLEIYLPAKEKATGAAIVICPGGGYVNLSYTHEGIEVARAFNELGVAAFVLKYRLPSDATMKDKSIGPLQDAQMAIKTVRGGASKWQLDPHKVGIIGFSAGGNLAALTGSHYNDPKISNTNNTSLRPDFMVLMYGVISMTDSLTHKGSHDNLIGLSPSAEQIRYFSNEQNVTKDTPPTMLVHAEDDRTVNVKNSLYFYQALLRNQVPADMIIYPKGGHGFGLNNKTTPDKWMDHCKNWMISNGWIK